ncbi:MAG: glycine C-acetyltransferase [Acidimicrobiia bacterium]|nr:glycine C-acetyltransferase [Acidimicrobiia bacterium]MDH3398784.1 glycine C-acetyltransferase [Acidimicrobiia bacterium]
MDKTGFLGEQVQDLRDGGLYNTIRHIDGPQGSWLVVDGKKVLNFCSNNYLGLANHPRLVEAAKSALDRYGIGPGAVRTIAGTMTLHDELEAKLTAFKGVEEAISLQSGYVANTGVIPALVDQDDVIITDALNHASIIDGVRLAKAGRKIYAHADVFDLRVKLAEARAEGARNILVITDGVFSMDGDIAPLDHIADAAGEFEAMVMVDDAHGEGVLGRGGRGIVDHFGLHGRVEVEVGTMSKAFGVVGGYVAGPQALIDWLRQRARPFLFSSAVTPPDAAACIASVEILEESSELVDRLWANSRLFKAMMSSVGFDIGHSETPITPVMLGDEKVAQEFSRRLFDEEAVFAQAIAYPTVQLGIPRIRVMISAAHTEDDLAYGAAAFTKVGKDLGVI